MGKPTASVVGTVETWMIVTATATDSAGVSDSASATVSPARLQNELLRRLADGELVYVPRADTAADVVIRLGDGTAAYAQAKRYWQPPPRA